MGFWAYELFMSFHIKLFSSFLWKNSWKIQRNDCITEISGLFLGFFVGNFLISHILGRWTTRCGLTANAPRCRFERIPELNKIFSAESSYFLIHLPVEYFWSNFMYKLISWINEHSKNFSGSLVETLVDQKLVPQINYSACSWVFISNLFRRFWEKFMKISRTFWYDCITISIADFLKKKIS